MKICAVLKPQMCGEQAEENITVNGFVFSLVDAPENAIYFVI
jgi:hypothetical protein